LPYQVCVPWGPAGTDVGIVVVAMIYGKLILERVTGIVRATVFD
jgi:hypothetical protein